MCRLHCGSFREDDLKVVDDSIFIRISGQLPRLETLGLVAKTASLHFGSLARDDLEIRGDCIFGKRVISCTSGQLERRK